MQDPNSRFYGQIFTNYRVYSDTSGRKYCLPAAFSACKLRVCKFYKKKKASLKVCSVESYFNKSTEFLDTSALFSSELNFSYFTTIVDISILSLVMLANLNAI